ncbi:MAG: SUF system NifU family Fe-S cluster assembly protein [candidate division KSB1 bacterium]|nr:SUF system NifU family Fe-S cluster assembly protein [candidate division KSB1 bacterium]MDZ7275206.1 SUF system NifU family Fe-S cluster assembly protein [candidate division KSB1 bacterium]MDZ7287375.1 SUF system NifU family Fe-S cluster assembly protein [candidate division KSB1 bacterium]MDZ7299489.1 SUF system NifU family Fe-S cluster assembly protein [candidate division KSB1 bacterium]MDZ7305465.1 SUF system NifU family Fe-S cluster assembly protein [candidate division KSB1 bacterium]
MDELRELYQQVILDHNKNPRNFGELANASHHAEGYNPLCGDRIHLFLRVADNIIQDIRFTGQGCAISKASASIMTSLVKGKSTTQAQELFDKFLQLITSDPTQPVEVSGLDRLVVFAGVREFPLRVKCASLAWHTLKSALSESGAVVTTE